MPGITCITPRALALETIELLKPLSCHPIADASEGGTPLASAIWPIADDVVRAVFGNRTLDYFLDRKTHLPSKVRNYFGKGFENNFDTIGFPEYADISGIQMPVRRNKGHLTVQINPAYDPNIFNVAPTIAAGPKQWLVK